MILDRLETLSAISFIEPAIPKGSDSGKNCLFVRVDEGKLVLTGGGAFVVKKAVLTRPNTTVEAAGKPGSKKPLPKTFMIPRSKLLAFKEMMKGDKEECKKLSKNDKSYLFVEIDDAVLTSYEGDVDYKQPKFEFKDLESVFDIIKGQVSEIPMMQADITTALTGFNKSEKIETSFTGPGNLIHFQQGDYEAVVIPPVESIEENDGEQLEIES